MNTKYREICLIVLFFVFGTMVLACSHTAATPVILVSENKAAMKIRSSKLKPITIDQVDSFEKMIGSKLPTDYREFLLASNGGDPGESVFDSGDELGLLVVQEFLGLGDKTLDYTLERNYETYVLQDRLPAGMLPIASEPGGNLFCLGISPEHFGKVFFWDHELEDYEFQYEFENMILLTDSFSRFIADLKADD
jgi:hypothetical protein